MLGTMRVAVDDALYPLALCVRPKAPIHVEAVGAGVKLNPGSCFRAGVDHCALIHFIGLAFEQQTTCEMAEHVDIFIPGRSD